MARIINQLEINLGSSCFRIEIGGHLVLVHQDQPVSVVRVHTLEEAKRLEELAGSIYPIMFRWKQGYDEAGSITVADFEKKISLKPSHYLPNSEIERLGFRQVPSTQ